MTFLKNVRVKIEEYEDETWVKIDIATKTSEEWRDFLKVQVFGQW